MSWKEEPRDWIWTGDTRHIAEEIKVQMIRRNIHQTDVANIIGVKRQALARRLSGHTAWRWSELDKLATKWGIHVWDITGEENDDIREADLTFEYFHAADQPVNQGPRGVKLTHKPTGAVIISNKEKSQLENKAVVVRLLRLRLLEQGQSADIRTPTPSG